MKPGKWQILNGNRMEGISRITKKNIVTSKYEQTNHLSFNQKCDDNGFSYPN